MLKGRARDELQRVLFVRIGWMRFYEGPTPGDERPQGGGRYNRIEIGHEAYNFKTAGRHVYGYFQPMSGNGIALERIDAGAVDKNLLSDVLVILFARRPKGGQVIVGWYGAARVHRTHVRQSPGKPRGWGHYCLAERSKCVLLPVEERAFQIPKGKGGVGQSNVFYPLQADGTVKRAPWIRRALSYIEDYRGSNLLTDPAADAEADIAAAVENALAASEGQGFAGTPKERKAIEDRAMKVAKALFRQRGFDVDDVSKQRPYDLLCKRSSSELHVEVKGTTSSGSTIMLTKNEVRHACHPANRCALVVVHSIQLKREKAYGGKARVIAPWRPERARLTPLSYIYRLS